MEKCVIASMLLMQVISVVFFAKTVNTRDWNSLDAIDKQKYVFQILDHVAVSDIDDELKNLSSTFDLERSVEKFNKIDDVKLFTTLRRRGILNRGEIFCLFCERQTEQAVAVFNILYGAKDFGTFFITACWMRQNINEMMFLYSFSIAVRHRTDCYGLILPAVYETYPFPFVTAKIQQRINVNLLTKATGQNSDLVFREDKYASGDEDSQLSYFTEDIGLNSFYYNFHLDYPFWMSDDVYGLNLDRRGELYIYLHRQLLVRFNLERFSQGLCDIRAFNPTQGVEKSYVVPVMFHNGVTLPARNINLNLYRDKYELVKDLEYLEYQIRDAVYKGHFQNCDGNKIEIQQKEALEAIGRIIYGNSRQSNENYKQDIMYIIRSLLSFSTNTKGYGVPSSMLQYYEIALRDPIFWELQTYFMMLLGKVIQKKPPYRREHLYYFGVDVLGVTVTQLHTVFDDNHIDISNIGSNKNSFDGPKILYKKQQLNHAPFNITIKIFSTKADYTIIRIFLGPAKDCYENNLDQENDNTKYVEIDSFMYNCNKGNNTVIRQSDKLNNIFTKTNVTKLRSSEIDSNIFNMTEYHNSFTGFPANLILPRGTKFGLRLLMFVIVSPIYQKYFWENNIVYFKRRRLCRYSLCLDQRPLGFPFDRRWEPESTFYPNMKVTEVFVYHK